MRSLFIDMATVCTKLGIDLEEAGYRLVGFCPFHAENRPSFNVYIDTNSWFCFSCRQGGSPFKLASLLVEEVQTWGDLIRWYAKEEPLHKVPVRTAPSLTRIRQLLSTTEVALPDATISDDPFLASLGVLYAANGSLAGRHIFPVMLHNRLVAYEARDFTGRLTPKTLALPRDVKIHSYLWNFDNIVAGLPVVVVEGTKDAVAVLSHGFINTVSSFGAQLTADQIMLLVSKSPSEVVIAYDADEAGVAGTDKAVASLLAWAQVSKIQLPENTDPWDVSRTVWEACFEARTQVLVSSRNKNLLKDLKQEFFS